MNWGKLATIVLSQAGTAINVVNKIKGAKGPEKKAAVLNSVIEGLVGVTVATDKDIMEDPEVVAAMSEFIDVYVKVQNAVAKATVKKQLASLQGADE
jgi:hypothetical protein